jgi:hypothetical protein
LNRKVYGGFRFKRLRLVPDQVCYDVEKVRTKDDALLTVKMMPFFQIHDPEKTIEMTHDPISDLINSVTADIIELSSNLAFDEFRTNADALNRLETMPTLVRAG